MNTRDIGFFLKVYECESINLAAEQLYITPQGLSNIISRMEKEIGEELFVRNRAGTYPTAFGKAFKPHAEKMIDHFEDALREILEIRGKEEGTVRLGYAFGALDSHLTEFPRRFQEEHQEYKVEYMELTDSAVEDFVERGELDIGFAASPDPEKFDVSLVHERRILFAVHDKSRFYDRESVTLAEICDEPLTLRNDQFATTRIVTEELQKRGLTPDIPFQTGGIVRSMVLCAEQKANTLILDTLVNDFRYDNVRMIPIEEDLKWPLYMITRRGRPLSRAARAFIDHIGIR